MEQIYGGMLVSNVTHITHGHKRFCQWYIARTYGV